MIRINKPGYLYILLTIVIGFSAVNTANNLLYLVTSVLLSYMLMSGIFGKRNLHGLEFTLEFPEERFACSTIPVSVTLTNKKRFMPAFLIRVTIGADEVLFPLVAPRSSALLHLNTVFNERGRHNLSEMIIASVFPFNFFTRSRRVPLNLELIVFPRLQPCSFQSLLKGQMRWPGEASSDQSGYDSDLLSIRNYVFGDPLKYISWKATAKTGQLKTKELSTTDSPKIMIDFNRLEQHNLEHAISCAAFLVIKAIRTGTAVGLTLENDVYRPACSSGHKTLLLTKLALYDSR